MAAQLLIDGNIIRLEEEITYNFQVGDVADFSSLKSNYTSSFRIPKISETVRLFEGLGIPGDISTIPYKINNVQCLDDYNIVYEGSLVILRTDRLYYHSTVISGVKNFADELGNNSLYDIGVRLTLKTISGVRDNISYPGAIGNSKFIIKPFVENPASPSTTGNRLNIDTLAEGFSLSYLLNLCFSSVGFTYTLPASVDLFDEMLAIPNPPLLDIAADGFLGVRAEHTSVYTSVVVAGNPIIGWEPWDFENVNTPPFFDSGNNFECAQTGTYIFAFDYFFARIKRQIDPLDGPWYSCLIDLRINNVLRSTFTANEWNTGTDQERYRTVIELFVGDVVSITIRRPAELGIAVDANFERGQTRFQIYTVGRNDVKERNVLSMKCVDFVREFCWRYALIPVQSGNHIDFVSFYDIVNESDRIDWSNKYIDRNEEEYSLDFAQNNYLRHSYVDELDEHYDLNLLSNNMNSSLNKDLISSNIFAPSLSSAGDNEYPVYYIEEGNGNVKYRTEDRIFFVKADIVSISSLVLMSRTLPGETLPFGGDFVSVVYDAAFSDNDRWKALSMIVNNTRAHKIDLHLTLIDIYDIDLTRLYYFQQEGSFYWLNRLQYKKGEPAKAEFVKVPCANEWVGEDFYCIQEGGENTGFGAYETLYNLATGETVPNVESNPNYIRPFPSPMECPFVGAVTLFECFANTDSSAFLFSIVAGGQSNTVTARYTSELASVTTTNVDKSLTWSGWIVNYLITYEGIASEVTDIVTDSQLVTKAYLSPFVGLEYFYVRTRHDDIFEMDIDGCVNLIEVNMVGATSRPQVIDYVINTLDSHGLSNGSLSYANDNTSGVQPSNACRASYDSLIGKGWAITGRPPLT